MPSTMLGNAVMSDACPGARTASPTWVNTRLNPCRHNVPKMKVTSNGTSARMAMALVYSSTSVASVPMETALSE